MPTIPSGQRTVSADHQAGTVLRETRLRLRPHRRPSAVRDRSRGRTRTLHDPSRHRRRDPKDQSRNRSNRPRPTPPGHHSPDPRNTLQPVSKTSLPWTRHRRPDEPGTLRTPDNTTLQQTKRGYRDHPAALEPEHRQASELQGPLLYAQQRVPPGWSRQTASPANLSGSVRTQDAEAHGGGGGRMDTALSHSHNLQDGSGHHQSIGHSGETWFRHFQPSILHTLLHIHEP